MLPQYQPGDILAYAQTQGWVYKVQGSEIILRDCPFCGKRDKISINIDTGAAQCFSAQCGFTGNYFTLRKELGDPVKQSLTHPTLAPKKLKPRKTFAEFKPFEDHLQNTPSALEYLAKRGLSPETIKQWHLGLKTESPDKHKVMVASEDGEEKLYDKDIDWLMIPYITKQGNIADVKYRALPPAPKRFRRWGGGDSILYGEHLLPEKKQKCDTVYLCEGEIDCMTLTQHGFTPALSTTTGAASFSPRWYDLIVASGAKRLVLVYDSDVDGQAGAEKLSKKFNDENREVINVILEDCKDANEYFQTHSTEDFSELVKASRPVEMDHILSMGAVIDRLEEQLFYNASGLNGIPSAFPNFNELINGGWWNGFLITVVGSSGTGKTSLILQELWNMSSRGLPTYMCCLEMPEEMILRKIINHNYHVPLKDIKSSHIAAYKEDLMKRQFYFGGGIKDVEKLAEVFEKAHKRYDLKAICFDNINYLCRDPRNVTAELGIVTKRLKELAVKLGIPIFAIAQPGKFDRAERIINENDVKGSSSIEQDSDVMMLMWRPTIRTDINSFGTTMGQANNMSPLTLIRFGKVRYSSGGETMLYFNGEIGTFRTLAKDEQQQLVEQAGPQGPSPRKGQRS